MALTESEIKVIIAAELKKQGFDKAEKATKSLTRSFNTLGAAVGVALSSRALFNFAKTSINVFAEEEKSVKLLTNSLENLGFAFSVPGIERYLEATEKATLVTKDQLRPAIVNLISTTLSANKATKLLNLALDASIETGIDLSQVTTAITRAYNGNYTGLAKLTKGYTAAELEASGFDNAISILSDRFSGSAAAATDTYSYKVGQLQLAAKKAQEEIGEGLVNSIAILGSGNYDQGLQDLVDFGTAIGKSFGYAAGAVNTLKQAYDFITLRSARDITLNLLGKTGQESRGGIQSPTQLELAKSNVEKAKEKAIRDKERKERERLARLEGSERKKRAEALKREQQLRRANTVFDIENIQIVAALQGQLTDDQRLRLTAMLALSTQNAEAAAKLSEAVLASNAAALAGVGVMMQAGDTVTDVIKKIIMAQTQVVLVGKGLVELPDARNPFENWDDVIAAILKTTKDAITDIPKASNPFDDWDGNITALLKRIQEIKDAITTIPPLPSPTVPPNVPGEDLGGGDPVLGPYMMNTASTGTSIVINVAGSVTTEANLIDAISEALFNKQKSGLNASFSSASI